MSLKKPKFWDYKRPNIYSYVLWPLTIIIQIINLIRARFKKQKKFNIRSVCVGNIYIGGTGKTSLSIKINEILSKKKIRSCFIKKSYISQIDEQKLLASRGKLFSAKKRSEALIEAEKDNYQIAIFDDGLQDYSIKYDVSLVCFNNLNWIGNGMTIPSGPLRESLNNLKNYNHVFLNGNSENLSNVTSAILNVNPTINIHIGKYIPLNLKDFNLNDNYLAFSGIGNHETFISMIKDNGMNVVKDIKFSDHYNFKIKDINKILDLSKQLNCKIITTEKDYLRLENDNIDQIRYIKTELHIVDEDKLINAIIQSND
ncbi:tetraacyldisaccharide 4'-kinase [Candidatus Pelagibacter bacterium nBUS_36]|uniref:tetraacyldisaccharide 4'-kinase n=1 Tax=Candidatus Pelagibacter bacterium nBUS_36 TaxID=3374194 RepID=UPI003EBA09B2